MLDCASLRQGKCTYCRGNPARFADAAFNRTLTALKMTTEQLLADPVRLGHVLSYLSVIPTDAYSRDRVLLSANFTDAPMPLFVQTSRCAPAGAFGQQQLVRLLRPRA